LDEITTGTVFNMIAVSRQIDQLST